MNDAGRLALSVAARAGSRIGFLKLVPVLAVVLVLGIIILGPIMAVGASGMNKDQESGVTCGDGSGGQLGLDGDTDAKAVAFMQWLMSHSLEALGGKPMTKEQAAGVAGNVMQESAFNPSAVNSIGAAGLFQWLGGRRDALNDFARDKGTPWDDGNTQMLFMAHELNTSHKDVADAMLASPTMSAREWAKFWDDEFEISGNDQIGQRMDNAARYFLLDTGPNAPACNPDGPPPNVGTDGWVSPVAPGTVSSSEYGPRDGKQHEGIDLPQGCGATIYAAHPGTVRVAGSYYGYGNAVIIDHGDGSSTLYGHMPWGEQKVSQGDTVTAGQPIGVEGNTGKSFGCHLHFEVWINDAKVDPRPFMAARGIDFGPLPQE